MAEGPSASGSPGDDVAVPLPEESADDLFEDAPCGYLSTLPDGTIIRANRTFLAWTGHSREDLLGRRRFADLLTARGRMYHETHYAPLLRMQGQVREILLDIVRADGSALPVLVNSDLRTDEAGRATGIRTVVTAASDRRKQVMEMKRERDTVRILQQVAATYAAAPSVAAIADVVVQAAVEAFGAVGSVLWLLDAEQDVLVRVAGSNAPDAAYLDRIPLDAPLPVVRSFTRRELVVIATLQQARRDYPRLAETMERASREAFVFTPLTANDAALGVVAFTFDEPKGFSVRERELLSTLGRQCGQALERARLYEAEQRLRAQGEVLQRMTAVLAAALDPVQIAEAVVNELLGNTVVDAATFAVVIPGEDRSDTAADELRLDVLARRGSSHDSGYAREHALDRRSPLGAVIRSLQPVFCTLRGDRAELFQEAEALGGVARAAALAVLPLVVDGRSIGVLVVAHGHPRRFPDDERAFLVAFAGQCAQALERARLHQRTTEAAERSAFLAQMSRALDEVPRFRQRAQRLVELLVPNLADWAGVCVTDAGESETVAAAGGGAGGRAALRGRLDLVERAVSAGGTVLAAATPSQAACAALPLRARKRTVGALLLGRARRFRLDELAFLEDLAERAALALENARLYEHERMVAHTLQQSLLATEAPEDPRFAVESYYRPAFEAFDVGGDWHDAFAVDGGKLILVVGDVVGRGLEAASAMGQLRSAVRALAGAALSPAEVIERLDGFVAQLEPARMATLAIVEVTPATGDARYACAGHPPPALFEPGAGWRLLWHGRSAPLGAYIAAATRKQAAVVLQPGTRLLLYTDGLVERRDRSLDFGFARLVEELDRHRDVALPALVPDIAEAMLVDEQTRDDVCMLCLSFGVADLFERSLPASVGHLAPLRRDLRAWLDGHGLERRDRDAVVLASSEAAANAVEHGYGGAGEGPVVVSAQLRDGTVEVRVSDRGRWRSGGPEPDRGRGLRMMQRLMDEVTLERTDGTTVLLRRRVRQAPA